MLTQLIEPVRRHHGTGLEVGLNRLTLISTKATSALIADQIRELIADGSFSPGAQITEVSLATGLGVSRGPVREAIQRLVQEGLLRNERNRGIFVPTQAQADVEDIYRVRAVIELSALELLMTSASTEFLAELDNMLDGLQAAVEACDYPLVSSLDLAFHKRMIQASGSVRLSRAFETLSVETRMVLNDLEFRYHEHTDVADWHCRMVTAFRTGNLAEARDALAAHNATVLQDLFVSGGKTLPAEGPQPPLHLTARPRS